MILKFYNKTTFILRACVGLIISCVWTVERCPEGGLGPGLRVEHHGSHHSPGHMVYVTKQ